MNRLLEIGFVPVGHWVMREDRLRLELMRHATQRNILYAFVCDGEVKYVGKTVRSLSTRMSGYLSPGHSQTTNINNNRRIRNLLADGVAVEIYALPDNGLLHYGRFHLNLAAALEDDIIRVLSPEWNGGKMEDVAQQATLEAANPSPRPVTHSFGLTLHPTYYRQGFFNVGVADQSWIGADGETIELFLGNALEPRMGTINRRANLNGTPRILGGVDLKGWFAANASVMDVISVEVYSPTSLHLVAGT